MSALEDEVRRIVRREILGALRSPAAESLAATVARQEARSALNGLAARLDPVGEKSESAPHRVEVSGEGPAISPGPSTSGTFEDEVRRAARQEVKAAAHESSVDGRSIKDLADQTEIRDRGTAGESVRDAVERIEAGIEPSHRTDQRDDRSILDLVNRRDPEAQPPRNPGRSIRDIVDEIESRIEPSHGDDQSRNDLTEVRVAPARQGRIAALESRVSDLERTVQILSDRTHESSSQVAGPVLVTPDLPATILAGTPDTVLLSGDGASVEGPATTTGPSISDTQTDRP